ncbi:MAG: hypothetical protein Q9M37_04345 [Desulfonauticus sp.]|nr:hypothetical protein [Desulfonauticus sp.]
MGYSPFLVDKSLQTKIYKQLGLNFVFKKFASPQSVPKSQVSPTLVKPVGSIEWENIPVPIRQKLLQQYRPAYSLWLYYDYYNDLEDPELNPRKKLILKILKALNWGKKISFWPLFRAKGSDYLPDMKFFYHALQEIRPVYIFCFGARCFKILLPDETFSYQHYNYKDRMLVALPDFNELLPDNRELKKVVWQILQKYAPA